MTLLNFVNKGLSLGAILGQLAVLASVIYFIFFRKRHYAITKFLGQHGLLLAFLVALASMCASLFYSMGAGFEPCELCWYQRIFMYPLVPLLGLALYKKSTQIIDYALVLAGIGTLFSLFHNYMYYYAGGLTLLCELGGMQVSCVKRYVFEFGYVTIPLMALTGFLMVITLLVFKKSHN